MTRISLLEKSFKAFCDKMGIPYLPMYEPALDANGKPILDETTKEPTLKYNGIKRRVASENLAEFTQVVIAQMQATKPNEKGVITITIELKP
jgi:hypothetical protein